jgi:hypothetical protein
MSAPPTLSKKGWQSTWFRRPRAQPSRSNGSPRAQQSNRQRNPPRTRQNRSTTFGSSADCIKTSGGPQHIRAGRAKQSGNWFTCSMSECVGTPQHQAHRSCLRWICRRRWAVALARRTSTSSDFREVSRAGELLGRVGFCPTPCQIIRGRSVFFSPRRNISWFDDLKRPALG